MLTVDYDLLGLEPSMMVLDLGAGFGRHAFETARRGGDVVAVDLSAKELLATSATFAVMANDNEITVDQSVSAIQGNALSLPFKSESFDRVIASEMLEHVPDDVGAMNELHRVLKPGGILAATVPAAVPEQICWWLNDQYHAPASPGGHVRIYGRPELDTKLTESGFDVVGHHRAHALHSPYWWLKCAVGLDNDSNPLVKAYLRFLTWDITRAPQLTRTLDRVLNPVLGKSLVVYAQRRPVSDGS